MARLRVMSKSPFQFRSISMPKRSHPLTLKVEDQLNKLRACEASTSSSSLMSPSHHPTVEMLGDCLNGLQNLYDCVNYSIQSPLIQQALVHHRHAKCVDEMLDGSLSVLDVCGTARDVLIRMKDHLFGIQSALRRRRIGEASFREIGAYISSKKKVKDEVEKCFRALKRTESKCKSSTPIGGDQQLVLVIHMLREVRSITIFIFETILSCVLTSRPTTTTKMDGWISILKCISTRQIACEGEVGKMSDVERVDAFLWSFYRGNLHKSIKLYCMDTVLKEFEKLDTIMQCFEDGLHRIFRRLIETRVSLLNMFNI